MRSLRILFGTALLLASPLGCAETPQPVAPVEPVAPVGPQKEAAPDLAPVAEPADIFSVIRWKSPIATLGSAASCAGVPSQLAEGNIRVLAELALKRGFEGIDSKQLAAVIAYEAPVDYVVALDPGRRDFKPLHAFSIGLTSLEQARIVLEAAGPLKEVAPGLQRIGDAPIHDLACAVGPAAGSAPARLICGPNEKALVALGPYLARNVPIAPLPAADLHAEVRFAPLVGHYEDDVRRALAFLPQAAHSQAIGEPHFDRSLEEAAVALRDEAGALLGDLDQATFDLNFDSAACLKATTSLQLKARSSWFGGTVAERANHVGPPPGIFWQLPKDADSASYAHASDPARFTAIQHNLRGFLEGKLAKLKVGTDQDRKALGNLLGFHVGKSTNVVFSAGHLDGPVVDIHPGLAPQKIADAIASGYIGWYVVGFDEGPETITKLLKDATNVWGRKGLIDPLKKALHNDAKFLPTAKLGPGPAKLGKGSQDLEVKFEFEAGKQDAGASGKAEKVKLSVHALVMADGDRTWLAIGANKDALVKHLLAAKTGAPPTETLASRPGLESLRSGKAASGSFVTLGSFTRALSRSLTNPALAGRGLGQLSALAGTLNTLPHGGSTPIFLDTVVSKEHGVRSDFTVTISKGTFEDLGAIALTALRLSGKPGLVVPGP